MRKSTVYKSTAPKIEILKIFELAKLIYQQKFAEDEMRKNISATFIHKRVNY